MPAQSQASHPKPLAAEDTVRPDLGDPRSWSQTLPGVIKRLPPAPQPRIALTFDACGGPGGNGYDARLIRLLQSEKIAATLFLTARWIDAHPEIAATLAAEPLFDIENHGASHKPCSVSGRVAFGIPGTKSVAAARREILGGSRRIEALTGRTPSLFRPATGYFDRGCVELVRKLGARPVGFTVSGDAGAGFSRQQVRRALADAPNGAIVLLHMNQPTGATASGLQDALAELRARGVQFVRLAEVLH